MSYQNSDEEITSYTYNGANERVRKVTGGTDIKYYFNGGMVINEATNGQLSATNLIGSGIEGRTLKTGGLNTLLKNGHGDVKQVYNGTTLQASYDYDAFGNELGEESDFNNPVRYAGEYLDEETNLIYLRARYYDPSIGRFTAEDPIRDGANWYVYCENNPIMFVDSSGLRLDAVNEHTAKVALGMIKYLTDDDGYRINDDGVTIYYVRSENSGKTLAQKVFEYAVNTRSFTATILFNDSLSQDSLNYLPVASDKTNQQIIIGKYDDYLLQSVHLSHEVFHEIDRVEGFSEKLISAPKEGVSHNDYFVASVSVQFQLAEALAITVENGIRASKGYPLRDDILGRWPSNYTTFDPSYYENNSAYPGVVTRVNGIPFNQILFASNMKSFGTNIIEYFMNNY